MDDRFSELALYRLRLARLDFEGVDSRPPERVEDLLRPEGVAAAFADARSAGSDATRGALRLVARAYLFRAGSRLADEIAQRDGGAHGNWRREHSLLQTEAAARARALRDWLEFEESLGELRAEHREELCQAARRVDAPSITGLLAAEHPEDPAHTARAFERVALAPLDGEIEWAARLRIAQARVPLLGDQHPADSTLLAWLGDFVDQCPVVAMPAVLRGLGTSLGFDPDTTGPQVVAGGPAGSGPDWFPGPERSTVVVGHRGGPLALGLLVGAFAAAGRATFLVRERGLERYFAGDPALSCAWTVLFRRLVLLEEFRERYGPRLEARLEQALSLAEALAPRLAWAYVHLVAGEREAQPGWDEVDASFRRAAARVATVGERLAVVSADPIGAAELRGTAYALLLEERLLSRFGRGWFQEPAAGRWIREVWDAECGDTAEGVARSLDLGTIEPTPILDRCRPARPR